MLCEYVYKSVTSVVLGRSETYKMASHKTKSKQKYYLSDYIGQNGQPKCPFKTTFAFEMNDSMYTEGILILL